MWRKPEALFIKTIAEMFGKKCEVLIHDFRNPQHSIVAIENGHVTGRKIGDPITDLALSVWKKNGYENKKIDRVINYKTKTKDGKMGQLLNLPKRLMYHVLLFIII